MNNTDKHIEELITKFHQANLTPDELEHLYTYFLAAKNGPEQWKADAAILRQLAVQHHCHKNKHILENKLKQLQQEEQKHNRKQLWTYTYRIAACVLVILAVDIAANIIIGIGRNTTTTEYTQNTIPNTIADSSTIATTADTLPTVPTRLVSHTAMAKADIEVKKECHDTFANDNTDPTPSTDNAELLTDATNSNTTDDPQHKITTYCNTNCTSNDVIDAMIKVSDLT